MRTATIKGAVFAAALVLTGCTAQDEGSAPTTSSSSSPTASESSAGLDQFPTAPSGVIDEDTGETIEPRPVPQWDEASQEDVVSRAENAMRAFARPDLDEDTWWAELEPLLTDTGAMDYSYVDPANIPAREVTGPGVIIEDSSAYVATVEVPTDAGTYQILLIRQDAASPWLVSRITPQESV
ncbi:MAG: hypothetical protein Q4G21_09650 [Dermabacter sp.]|nr:hypothetical protein [Dermabacter sp.]